MKKVKIGYPLEYEDEEHIIRNGVFLRENEVEALNKKLKQLEAYENMRKEAIEELSKDYKNLPDIDEWYATDKQWHNYYFEKSEQDNYKIENTLNILNKVGEDNE